MDEISKAKEQISEAAKEAVNAIAEAARNATKVLADAAAEASKLSSSKQQCDHDLLIRIETRMEGIKADIKDLKDGTSTKIDDHERRMKKSENKISVMWVIISLYSIAVGAAFYIILTHISK